MVKNLHEAPLFINVKENPNIIQFWQLKSAAVNIYNMNFDKIDNIYNIFYRMNTAKTVYFDSNGP